MMSDEREFTGWDAGVLHGGFTGIPNSVLLDPDIPARLKIFYGVIVSHFRPGQYVAWPSQARLAECCGDVTERTVRRWKADLEKRGLLKTERRSNKTLLYRLCVPVRPDTDVLYDRTLVSGPTGHECPGEVNEGKYMKGKQRTVSGGPETPTLDNAAQLKALREDVPHEDRSLIDEFLDACAAENKSNTIMMSRRFNETKHLLELREDLGVEPWRYGMRSALHRDEGPAPNLNYVKKAARSYKPTSKVAGGSDPDDITPEEWQRMQLEEQGRREAGLE